MNKIFYRTKLNGFLMIDSDIKVESAFYPPYVEDGGLDIGNNDPLLKGAIASKNIDGLPKLFIYQGLDVDDNQIWKQVGSESNPLPDISLWNGDPIELNKYVTHPINGFEYLFRSLVDNNISEPSLESGGTAWTFTGVTGYPDQWSNSTTYGIGVYKWIEVSSLNFSIYKSLVSGNLGNPPSSSPGQWEEIGAYKTPYSSSETYNENDFVVDDTDLKNYISNINSNTFPFDYVLPGSGTWKLIGIKDGGVSQDLQSVTEEGAITDRAITVTGFVGIDYSVDGLKLHIDAESEEGGLLRSKSGSVSNGFIFTPTRTTMRFSGESDRDISVREQNSDQAGVFTASRVEISPAENGNEAINLDQLNEFSSSVLHKSGNETKDGNLNLISNAYLTTDFITFIGDSITDGAPGPSSGSKRYSTLTSGWVGLSEVNHGIGSSTMQKGAPINPLGGINMQDRLGDIPNKSSTTAVLVFEFGANDFGYNGGDYTTANYKIAYSNALNNAISKGWQTKDIYVLSPPYINATGFAFYGSINGGNTPLLSRLIAYIAATMEIAQDFNTNYLDLYSHMASNGGDVLLHSDGVHPNDMGCRVIASFLADQINRNYSPLYIYNGDDGKNIGYFSNKGGIGALKLGNIEELGLVSPTSIDLGGSYCLNPNDVNNAKLKLCNNGGGTWGFGVSGAAGLEYFSGTNKHTFYGALDLKNQVNCDGNIFGLQFICSGMNAAYNYLDRSNNAKSWAMFAENSYSRWRSGIDPLMDLMILHETTGVLSVKGPPVGLTDVVRLDDLNKAIPVAGSFSGSGTGTTVFTVTIGVTKENTTYKVNVTPTNILSSAMFYITNKTTTTFDVVYSTALTGTVTFDWSVFK